MFFLQVVQHRLLGILEKIVAYSTLKAGKFFEISKNYCLKPPNHLLFRSFMMKNYYQHFNFNHFILTKKKIRIKIRKKLNFCKNFMVKYIFVKFKTIRS